MKRKSFTQPDKALQERFNDHALYLTASYRAAPFRRRISDKFEGIDFGGRNLTGSILYAVAGDRVYAAVFKNCNFENTILVNARVNDVRWIGCDVTGAEFTGTGVRPEQFLNCPGSDTLFPKAKRGAKQKKRTAEAEPFPFVA